MIEIYQEVIFISTPKTFQKFIDIFHQSIDYQRNEGKLNSTYHQIKSKSLNMKRNSTF